MLKTVSLLRTQPSAARPQRSISKHPCSSRAMAAPQPPSDPNGPKPEVDWDSAWSSYNKLKKGSPRSLFKLDMEKYVSRKPSSGFPLVEEIDPIRRSEKGLLNAWTDPKFTYAGFSVIFGIFVYVVIIVGPPPL